MALRYVNSLSVRLRALSLAAGLFMGLGVNGAQGMTQTTTQDKPVPMVPAPPLSKTKRVLTLERLYDGPDLSGPRATGVQLSPDGSMLTFLKPIQGQSSLSLWAMPSGGGEPYVLLDAGALNDSNKVMSEAEKAMRERMRITANGIISYSWSSDSKVILVPLDGDIFRVDPLTKAFDRLTETKGDEIDARLSTDGQSLAYVRDGALYTLDLATKSEVRVSPEATDTKHYGAAEFIAQEELARYSGFWISPQSDRIAYQSTDESGVEIAERVEVGGSGIKTIRQRYPFAGQQNAVVKLFVRDLKGGTEPIEIDLGGNVDIYLARVQWSKDAKALFVQRLSRDQKTLELLKYDPVSGKGQVLIRDTDAQFIELSDDFRELSDGRLIWSSEDDGNRHLYLYSAKGKKIRQITKGDFAVQKLIHLDEKAGEVYYEAGMQSSLEMHLNKVSLSGKKPPVTITKNPGWWSSNFAANGQVFFATHSSLNSPPSTGIYDKTGKLIKFIEPNRLDATHPYYPYSERYSDPEYGVLKAEDGHDMHYMMLKPVYFKPERKYPVIVSIYGGPARAMVNKAWVNPINRVLQEEGYIVFTLDNRGTPGRSAAFLRAIHNRFGDVDVKDQIVGAEFLKSLPYVDSDRIGMMGWSQGGFLTLMALSAKNTPFRAGVAGAPPTDWRLYDTAYTERYMSKPDENQDGYRNSDVLNRIDQIKPGSLLLIHGMADDNVLLQNSTRVMQALQEKSIPFEVMLYPGERHGIRGAAKTKHRFRLSLEHFRTAMSARKDYEGRTARN